MLFRHFQQAIIIPKSTIEAPTQNASKRGHDSRSLSKFRLALDPPANDVSYHVVRVTLLCENCTVLYPKAHDG